MACQIFQILFHLIHHYVASPYPVSFVNVVVKFLGKVNKVLLCEMKLDLEMDSIYSVPDQSAPTWVMTSKERSIQKQKEEEVPLPPKCEALRAVRWGCGAKSNAIARPTCKPYMHYALVMNNGTFVSNAEL
ncbi:unnamed protein product [Sphenostylis stenocarpa]|uniref:Uncharacterized protein n=1 Tax=Sphenostylis stenocarpa TaxID=92480 RepID=A0AA86VEB3_9FABA|nr:unnamed protein product [Sphenostylis stenocarpa]